MDSKAKRPSWMDVFKDYPSPPGISEGLAREYTILIDNALHGNWELGRNLILLWAPDGNGIMLLVVRHYRVGEIAQEAVSLSIEKLRMEFLEKIFSQWKMVTRKDLKRAAGMFGAKPVSIPLPFTPGEGLSNELINGLLRRYSISRVRDRAVVLLDIVGFSLLSPLEQVTQLNSLSYSVNAAHSKLISRNVILNFARSTTGDGYYIWNRASNIKANVDLYNFMHLILADNAIARQKSKSRTTPLLRACFHVGDHYEYYQAESLSPSTFSYLVGKVTIELARMIEHTLPRQILVGDFSVPMPNPDTGELERIDSIEFIRRTRDNLTRLSGLILAGDTVDSIKCYLTGSPCRDGGFSIKKYKVSDKHGLSRYVYNAKVNIHRQSAETLFLGIQDSDIDAFRVAAVEEVKVLLE